MFLHHPAPTAKQRWQYFAFLQGLALLAALGAWLYRAYLDTLPGQGRWSLCLIHDMLHLYCPGCGGTRAMVALLRGQWLHSLCCNPISAYLAVGFLVFDIRTAIAILCNKAQLPRLRAWYFWTMLGIALVLCIVRNVLIITTGYDYLGDLGAFWHS